MRPERLLLLFGVPIAALTLAYWTWMDYATFGLWTLHGVEKGLFVLTAVLLLYVVIRIARIVVEESSA